MDSFDQRLPQRLARYPALAGPEDGPAPYDEYAPYDEDGTAFVDADGEDGEDGPRGRELPAAAVTGFVAVAVAAGVANFAAAFFRPQASPVRAVSGALAGHGPAALRHLAGQRASGGEDTLLLGLGAAVALIALAIGILAGRRPRAGLAGTGLLGLLAVFVVLTRPGSRATDAIPSVIGALVAIAVVAGLIRVATSPAAAGSLAGESAREPDGYDPAGYEPPAYEPARYEPPPYWPAASPSPAYRTGWTA